MNLVHLELRNFRSYSSLKLDFDKGITLIEGSNAAGKSNLAEAIHYLSLAHSWRCEDDSILIKDGERSALIKANVESSGLHRTIEIVLQQGSKKISVNGKPIHRLSELSKLTGVIVFSPKDVSLFSDSPGERRSFLNVSLSKQSLDYFALIVRYERLLEERNAALKKPKPDLALLEVVTERIIETSEPLVRLRHLYVGQINKALPDIVAALLGPGQSVKLNYVPFIKDDDHFKDNAQKAFKRSLESDLLHKATGIGPHREDLSLSLNGKDIVRYGSQGENRLAVISLKLAPYFLVEDEGRKPILVLDDVLSELDEAHAKALVAFLKPLNQTFITATHCEIDGASIVEVSGQNATRRK